MVKADTENNILFIKLIGVISKAHAEELKELIMRRVNKLQPGFDIINDMTNFRLANGEALAIAEEVMKHLMTLEIGKIVRVVGSSQNAVIQAADVTKKIEGYQASYVPTMKEAYNLLGKSL